MSRRLRRRMIAFHGGPPPEPAAPFWRLASIGVSRTIGTKGERTLHDFPAQRYAANPAVWQGHPTLSPREGPDGWPANQITPWDEYVSTHPGARPNGSKDLIVSPPAVVATAGAGRNVVASRRLPIDREGVIEVIAFGEAAAAPANFGLAWEVLIDGSRSSQIDRLVGFLGKLENPLQLVVRVPAGSLLELVVTDPAAPTNVLGYMRGFLTPITRGKGRTSAGYEPRH